VKPPRFSAADRRFMARALALAERGRGTTNPNPVVGAVIWPFLSSTLSRLHER